MSVYTISRKMGSKGTTIGRKLAVRLGYDYVDKHHLSKMMRDYGFSNFDRIYETLPTIRDRFDENREKTISFLAEMILAVAHHDNVVIAGRGSFGLLDGFSDVINIRVKAPMACRIHRIMEDEGRTFDEAKKQIDQNDRVRRRFVESDLRFSYIDTTEFDLMLDTSVIPPDMCVEWLVEAHEITAGKRDDERPSVREVRIDSILVNHVKNMLTIFRENPNYVRHGQGSM